MKLYRIKSFDRGVSKFPLIFIFFKKNTARNFRAMVSEHIFGGKIQLKGAKKMIKLSSKNITRRKSFNVADADACVGSFTIDALTLAYF